MTIDAEVHFWKYTNGLQAPLILQQKKMQQDQLPGQVQLNLKRNGVDACLAVAAEPTEVETRFLAELTRTHPLIRGVIGWIDLTGPGAVEKIAELKMYPEIRGYRLSAAAPQDLPASVMEFLATAGLTLDMDLPAETPATFLKEWMDAWPNQRFVISAAGNPDARKPPSTVWTENIKLFASCPNCSCKVSGLFTRAAWNKWRPADFYPFLETLFAAFGSARLLYASDWPFLLLSGAYVQWKSLLDKFTGHLTPDDRAGFYGLNAARVYGLATDAIADDDAGWNEAVPGDDSDDV